MGFMYNLFKINRIELKRLIPTACYLFVTSIIVYYLSGRPLLWPIHFEESGRSSRRRQSQRYTICN